MSIENDLTYLQKTALKGEIAYAVSTCSHNADIKYRLYLILKDINDELKPFILEAFKEAVTFDEEIIDRIYLETLSDQTPDWLWVEKVVSDIEVSIKLGDTGYVGAKLDINKINERKKIVESAFISFGRTAILLSPLSANLLFNTILENNNLNFLNTACFYLKSICNEAINKNPNAEVKKEIMELEFDIRGMLHVSNETETLEELENNPLKNRKPIHSPKRGQKPIQNETIVIEGSITPNELSEYLSQKVIELFEGINESSVNHVHGYEKETKNNQSPNKQIKYVVEKVWFDSEMRQDIRTCDTLEEAVAFARKLEEEYPEQLEISKFVVKKQQKD